MIFEDRKFLIGLMVSVTTLSGCVNTIPSNPRPTLEFVKPVFIEAIIKEGTTTKSEVRSILGQPQGLGKSVYGDTQLMYKFKDRSKVVHLKYYDKSGDLYEYNYAYDPNDNINEFWILVDENDVVNGIETL